jgi:hypothetical protein
VIISTFQQPLVQKRQLTNKNMTIAVKIPEANKVQSRIRRIKKKKTVITDFSGEFSESSRECFV